MYFIVFQSFQGVSVHFVAEDYDSGISGNDLIDDINLNLMITSQDVQEIVHEDHKHGPNNNLAMR